MIPAIFIAVMVILDRVTKLWAVNSLQPVRSIPVIEGVFRFTYVENSGAAFGIFAGQRWAFVVFTIAIFVGMVFYYRSLPKEKSYSFMRFCLLLVAAGAVGNFIDRLLYGYVVDFFHFELINFPVFNLADCYITIGVAIICFLLLFVIKDDPSEEDSGNESKTDAELDDTTI